jgi:hypothetical protein
MSTTEKLYKENTNGSIQVWWGETSGSKFRTHSGKKDGKIVISKWTECLPKNVGKKNETTGEQQAELELKSLYDKKLRGKYVNDIALLANANNKFVSPMLANKYNNNRNPKDDIKNQNLVLNNIENKKIYSQPKLDGIRAIISKNGIFSRTGTEIVAVPHIYKAFEKIFAAHPTLMFDGELYNHDLKSNFNEIVSLVRKTKPSEQDLIDSETYIQFHYYDLVSKDKFIDRFLYGKLIINKFCTNKSVVKIVQTDIIKSQDQLDELYESYLSDGFEGQMIRTNSSGYENKRSKQLLKRKESLDEEFKIVDILEGIGNRAGTAGRILCAKKNGVTFEANLRGTFEYMTEVLQNSKKYINGEATVRYYGLTPDGKPRFGVVLALFEKKRNI